MLIGLEGKGHRECQEFGFRIGTAKIGERRIVDYRRGDQEYEARVNMVARTRDHPATNGS